MLNHPSSDIKLRLSIQDANPSYLQENQPAQAILLATNETAQDKTGDFRSSSAHPCQQPPIKAGERTIANAVGSAVSAEVESELGSQMPLQALVVRAGK